MSSTYLTNPDCMPVPSPQEITGLLRAWGQGDSSALEQLVPLVEAELHRLAHRYLLQERPGHTLQTTALVNEAYLRLLDWKNVQWQDRAHFVGFAARLMRYVLVGYARRQPNRKAAAQQISLDQALEVSPRRSAYLVAVGSDGTHWRTGTHGKIRSKVGRGIRHSPAAIRKVSSFSATTR